MSRETTATAALPGFFSWVKPAVTKRRTLKTWIRCCVVLAAVLILMVDNKTLSSMGQAGFFAAIVAVMLPPSIALSLFLYAALTLVLGMLIGWAWGCAAMAASLSVRSQALLEKQQMQAQASFNPNLPASIQLQILVFHGFFLDPRSSAVYGAFLFIGTFILGAIQAFVPKLALMSIFGAIVLDIMCSLGPSFPNAQYTLAKLFLIPTAYYLAIAIASLILLFPESLNRIWLLNLHDAFLEPTLQLICLQSKALQSLPSDRQAWAALNEKGNQYRRSLMSGTDQLIGQVGMIDLEISIGKLGPTDLKHVSRELKSLMFRAAGLHSFNTYVNDLNTQDAREEAALKQAGLQGKDGLTAAGPFATFRQQIRERESQHGHDLDTLIPILEQSSAQLRKACEEGMKCTILWFKSCNTRRWTGFFSKLDTNRARERHADLSGRLKELETSLDEFRKVERIRLIKPFERFFDPQTGVLLESIRNDPKSSEMFAARSLYMCFVFLDTLDAFAERLIRVFRILVDLDVKRPKPRLWAPSGFGKIGRRLMSEIRDDTITSPLSVGTSRDPTTFHDGKKITPSIDTDEDGDDEQEAEAIENPRQNPDALPPRTSLGRTFVRLGSVLRFFKSSEGIFALRMGIVSVAIWVPSVCKSSAWFYYENKGIWALIMSQTGLALYAGDQIAGFVARISGTLVGLLVGMAAWYIGAGHGDGNPYGVVIATTIITAPFLLGRIAAPPQQIMIWTMAGVTTVFVVGYSWINTHEAVLANPGVGVTLGWKRALLVIIGFTAVFVVMMFPTPNSSRTLVRKTLGASASELASIFAGEVEAFLAEEARARAGHVEKVEFVGERGDPDKVSAKEKRVRRLAKRILIVSTRLNGLAPSLKTALYEPQVQGLWPVEQYHTLHRIQMKLIHSFILLISAFVKLDTRWCSILVHRTPFLNPNLLSDIFSNLSILSDSLRHAHPLPGALPRLRDRLVYHERHSGRPPLLSSISKLAMDKSGPSSDTDSESELGGNSFAGGRVDGSSIGFEELTLDVLMDDQLPAHCTAVVTLSNIITLIDEMTDVVRNLCGEATFRGFEALQRDFLGRSENMLGTGLLAKVEKVD